MKTSKRSLVRGAAFLALAAITAWGVAGAAMAGLSFRSGYVPVGEVSTVTPLADPAEGGQESDGPVISGVAAESITETGATIVWETDVLATSQVDYGPTSDYGSTATGPPVRDQPQRSPGGPHPPDRVPLPGGFDGPALLGHRRIGGFHFHHPGACRPGRPGDLRHYVRERDRFRRYRQLDHG